MSELTRCDHCSLEQIKYRARMEGRIITLRPGGIGTNVFAHFPATIIPPDATTEHPNFVASMMSIGKRCGC